MNDCHGIIFAYGSAPELGELVSARTAASLPFCARYRLIDFSLSSLRNAGIVNTGVIMKRDYQSLLDHLGSGKAWDMSHQRGGLRLLPPFGLPEYHTGSYTGTMEALNAVGTYVKSIKEKYVVLLLGDMCANLDLSAAIEQHRVSGTEITAICADSQCIDCRNRVVVGSDGFVTNLINDPEATEGYACMEAYIINRDVLVELMDHCRRNNLYRFHKEGIAVFLQRGGRMDVYLHREYYRFVRSTASFYQANMDMLDSTLRHEVFPSARPVHTRVTEGVSTYYGSRAHVKNSLIADNCIIEGEVENSIIFAGARIGADAVVKNCIVFAGADIGSGAKLECVIADKDVTLSPGIVLTGNPRLPSYIPKGRKI